jgi:WD40 repeat protein
MKSNTVNAYESEIMCLKACRIEKLILVGTSSRDKSQKIFSFSLEESFKLLYTSNDHNGVTTCISFSGNGQWLVTFSQDKVLDLNFVSETVYFLKLGGYL